VHTGWFLWRQAADRRAAARLFARLWWRERRHREAPLSLLRLLDGDAVVALWVSEFNDLHVIREAFGDRVYELPVDLSPRLILDLGANIGASVLWFHRHFPDAEIHGVEPDRRSFEKLLRNVDGVRGVTVHHAAVGGENGWRTFYEAERGWESSLTPEAARRARRARVRVLSLPTLMHDRVLSDRLDLLKLDVEGAEWELLPQLRLAELTDVVAGELHAGMFGDEAAERDAWRHGLSGFDVRFTRREGSGHFLALSPKARRAAAAYQPASALARYWRASAWAILSCSSRALPGYTRFIRNEKA
jgi:FkbM family methyltransferase